MENIYHIILELRATSSRLEKEAILKRNESALLKDILSYTYDPYINFGIKKIPDYDKSFPRAINKFENSLAYFINNGWLDDLKDRKITGNSAILHLSGILNALYDRGDVEVIKLIIKKDLDCGISYSTINKVFPKLIPEFDVMKCHNNIDFIEYPCYAQIKMDGARVNVERISNEGDYICYSSSGRSFSIGEKFKTFVKAFMHKGEIFDGELVCYENDIPMDRKKSNGIILKAIKGTISEEECDLINFVAWDILPRLPETYGYSYVPETYERRFKLLEDRFYIDTYNPYIPAQNFIRIKLVQTKIINNTEEAYAFFDNAISQGHEGLILKNFKGLWEPKRVKHQGKMKGEYECDLIVTGFALHSKDESLIGSLECSTIDGIKFDIGSGLNDELNKIVDFETKLLNKIVCIRFNQLVGNRNNSELKLYLPRLIEVRFDKEVPDSMDEIKLISKWKG